MLPLKIKCVACLDFMFAKKHCQVIPTQHVLDLKKLCPDATLHLISEGGHNFLIHQVLSSLFIIAEFYYYCQQCVVTAKLELKTSLFFN